MPEGISLLPENETVGKHVMKKILKRYIRNFILTYFKMDMEKGTIHGMSLFRVPMAYPFSCIYGISFEGHAMA